MNEQGVIISIAWDMHNLKFTFKRSFSSQLMLLWGELLEIAKFICSTNECDSATWQFDSEGTQTTRSLYIVVNFREIRTIYSPALWKLSIPPRVHIFYRPCVMTSC